LSGNEPTNWSSSTSNVGVARNGGSILGTPKSVNSNFIGNGMEVRLISNNLTPLQNEIVEIEIQGTPFTDFFAYGLEVNYDPSKMRFLEAIESTALNSDGIETAFYAELEN